MAEERILLQQLVAQGIGTVVGQWFDLSQFDAGAFYVEYLSGTGTLTPTIQQTIDVSAGQLVNIPASQLTQPTAVSAVGTTEAPVSSPMELAWVRVSSAVTVGPVTANIYFMGRTN